MTPDPGCVFCGDACERMDHYESLDTPAPSYLLAHVDGCRILSDNAPLVPGHVLLVPDEHVPSVAVMPPDRLAICSRLTDRLLAGMRASLGPDALVFEHGTGNGPATSDGQSCCLVHAHLHLLPVRAPLGDWFTDRSVPVLAVTRDLRDLSGTRGAAYLYAQQHGAMGTAWECAGLPSQLLRRLIGEHLDVLLWNWRDSLLLLPPAERVAQAEANLAAARRALRAAGIPAAR